MIYDFHGWVTRFMVSALLFLFGSLALGEAIYQVKKTLNQPYKVHVVMNLCMPFVNIKEE